MDLFLEAAKSKMRFDSSIGTLTVEDLFDLPLTSEKKASLNSVGAILVRKIKDHEEENLVAVPTPELRAAKMKLDVVKAVIEVKQEENRKAKTLAAKKARRERIMGLLKEKDDQADLKKSRDELLAELDGLTDEEL